jgi:hypothetical protein
MNLMIIDLVSRSPLARMLAVILAEYLVRKGFIAAEDISQTVEDTINIIGFLAMVATLLIWQWKTHHPAKQHIEPVMPESENPNITTEQIVTVGLKNRLLNKVLGLFIVRPQQ